MIGTDGDKLWADGLSVVRKLQDNGFEAYFVGGCVRDKLLGRPIRDIDIASSALPEQVMAVFAHTVPTGLQHGTVTVVQEGVTFEVTTFRCEEGGYADARRPNRVAFVRDVKEDLARRDFTINAIAIGADGAVVDPFGGRGDLSRGIVRCVGDARDRFGEDALRMVRAIRFAAELRFRMTLSVWRAILCNRARLGLVAMERVAAEWDKMMAGGDPDMAAMLVGRSGLLAHLKEPLPERIVAGLARKSGLGAKLGRAGDSDVRWAALLTALGCSTAEADGFCRALRFSVRRQRRIAGAVGFARRWEDEATAGAGYCGGERNGERNVERDGGGECDRERNGEYDGECDGEREVWIEIALDYGRNAAEDWLAMQRCFESSCSADNFPAAGWLAQMPVWTPADLTVRGDELARRLGKQPGPWVAVLLRKLLGEVASGRCLNEPDMLHRLAEKIDGPGGSEA